MLKVLHIIDSGGFYGAEVMLLHLIQEQIKQGLEPIIASIEEKRVIKKAARNRSSQTGF